MRGGAGALALILCLGWGEMVRPGCGSAVGLWLEQLTHLGHEERSKPVREDTSADSGAQEHARLLGLDAQRGQGVARAERSPEIGVGQ
jgi:hypothetical protein